MKRLGLGLLAFCLVSGFGLVSVVHADIFNGSFEGGLLGWTTDLNGGSATVVTSYTGETLSYAPVEGNNFLLLGAGDADTPVTASRSFTTTGGGGSVSGWAGFDGRDVMPFNDWASVQILDSSNNVIATPWFEDISTNGNLTSTPWTRWTWIAPAPGQYTVQFSVANAVDSIASSAAVFDATHVPEPSTLFLIGTGLIGFVASRGFKKA